MKSFDKVKAVDFHLQEAINKTLATWVDALELYRALVGNWVPFAILTHPKAMSRMKFEALSTGVGTRLLFKRNLWILGL